MEKPILQLLSPEMQYGFAALCLILLGILCWFIHSFIKIVQHGTSVVEKNSAVIESLGETLGDNQLIVQAELRRLTESVDFVKGIVQGCIGRRGQ